jgi:prepilin-type N-terminal cleavage/methylation domain-containing protein
MALNLLPARMTSRKGFTLIELLVVVVIIGILASVALPSFVGAQDKARNASVQSNARGFQMAVESYKTEHNGAGPSITVGNWAGSDKFTGTGTTYFPGGKLACSPWADATVLQVENVPLSTGKGKGKGKNKGLLGLADSILKSPPDDFSEINEDVGKGQVPTTFTTSAEYGSIVYDYDDQTQFYLIYATGKKGKDAIVVSAKSNAGQ